MVGKKKMMSNLEEIWENVHFKLRTAELTEMYAELLSYIGEDDQSSGKKKEEVREDGSFVCFMSANENGYGVYYECLLDMDLQCLRAEGRFSDKKDCPYWRKK